MNSHQLNWLTDDDQYDALIDIWSDIKALTGAAMYQNGTPELGIQLKVLHRFIVSNPQFSNLTKSEILHAFYLNMQGEYGEPIKHYYKELNAEYVGSVLLAYLKYKAGVYARHGKNIKALLEPPQQKKQSPIPTEQEYQQVIQQHYDLYLMGKTEYIYLMDNAYRLLRLYGAILAFDKEQYSNHMLSAMKSRIQFGNSTFLKKSLAEIDEIKRVHKIYEGWQEPTWPGIPRDELTHIAQAIRKKLYLQFFENMKELEVKDIFTEMGYSKNKEL